MMEHVMKLFRSFDWHLVCYGGGSQTGSAYLRKGNKIYHIVVEEVDEAVLKEAKHI
jgi:hypothetical protein